MGIWWRFHSPGRCLHQRRTAVSIYYHTILGCSRSLTCIVGFASYDLCSWRDFGNIAFAGALIRQAFAKMVWFIVWIRLLTDAIDLAAELSLLTKARTSLVVKYTRRAAIFWSGTGYVYRNIRRFTLKSPPPVLGAGPKEKRVIADLTQSMDPRQKDL